ncbi:aromatic ring-hydroxylating oxygenase subunit alpha [Candidatus Viadribacter manganicus]|nr:aromatic ring-hydroxylating dioxygenase subunit alpha [Candidatus Viadribacter manganicus]
MMQHADTTLDDWVDAEQRAALRAPIEEARGLPGRAYSAGFYELEQRALFPRTWAVIGMGADLPEPGDAFPVDLAGSPLVMVRQKDGAIRVFHNQCRHRGMAVVTAPKRTQTMVCPWHGWAYELNGDLRVATRLGGESTHQCPGFDQASLGLREVRSARWHDWVLVNLDGAAASIEEHLRPLNELLDGIGLDELLPGPRWSGEYPGNWKIAIEGGVEDYHLPMAHPQLFEGVSARPITIATGPNFAASIGEPLRSGAIRRPAGIEGVRMNEAQRGRSFVLNLFPTGMILLHENSLMLGVFTPNGPARTRLETRLYFHPTAFGTEDRDAWRVQRGVTLARVVEQDHDFVLSLQNNATARDRAGLETRFSPYWEGAVLHFQRMVLDTLERGEPGDRNK